MKKIICILLIIFCMLLISCDGKQKLSQEQIKQEQRWHGFKVIVIDSCEYLIKTVEVSPGMRCATSAGYLAHKGNCKFCAKRQKQILNK